jgi:hypothetical protein
MNIELIVARCEAAIKNLTGTAEIIQIVGCGNGTIIAKTTTKQYEFNYLTGQIKPYVWGAL